MKIVACNSNRPLAEAVAATLNLPLTRAAVRRFADMEVFVEIHENVRGEDVFVVQSTSFPGQRQPDGVADHAGRAAAQPRHGGSRR
jgi:phosphoribosylpyrophosphate synthetase